MTAILVRFPNESVKLDDVEEPRVLTALEVIYEGGSLDGKTRYRPRLKLKTSHVLKAPANNSSSLAINPQDGLVLQVDGSAPIFSPRSASAFMVSLTNTPGLGGTKSLGTAT